MPDNKSSDISIWDDFSEKLESLREALNTPLDANDTTVTSFKGSDLLYHFTERDTESAGKSLNVSIESLREILNTPIDETISPEKPSEETDSVLQNNDQVTENSSPVETDDKESYEAAPSYMSEIHTETDDGTSTTFETKLDDVVNPHGQIQKTYESDEPDYNQEIQDVEAATDIVNEMDVDDIPAPVSQIQETDEPDEPDYNQKIEDVEAATDIVNEMYEDDVAAPVSQISITDEPGETEINPDYQDVEAATDTASEMDVDDVAAQNGEIQDVDIKTDTEQPNKSEELEKYWKENNTANPYILKVDESREELNRSLEKARELAHQQSEETPAQGKKRFQLRFTRDFKNGNHKSKKGKAGDNHSKSTPEFKPMVYEMLEPKKEYQDDHNNGDNLTNQDNKLKQDKEHKGKKKNSDDRAKSIQEKEIINHRNRLEKSRSLGVPVFVKKPVNLEQIRQLKSMLTSQNNVTILVDTGSSQGRLLVVSGQDPDTLINTLSQLPIVKSTTVDDETITIIL